MKLFESIFSEGMDIGSFLICMCCSIVIGVMISFMCYYKTRSSKSFFVSTTLMPITVAMVIMLVNGNIGIGIAVAGAFSLVRFRSVPGSAKEICIIFVSMASGLGLGTGYVVYSFLFALIAGGVIMITSHFNVFEPSVNSVDKVLKITIPESLNYQEVFDEIFNEYLDKYEILKVKTTNMGSMYRLTYNVKLKDVNSQKQFMDAIRCRNGNLEISLEKLYNSSDEL